MVRCPVASFGPHFILELSQDSVKLIAQLLHIRAEGTKDGLSIETLKLLNQQTNCVELDPEKHGVFTALKAPATAKKIPLLYYVPF